MYVIFNCDSHFLPSMLPFSFLAPPSLSNHLGPNDLSLFQPKCPETQDLAAKLFIYYHAKAVKGQTCLDLSPCKPANQSLNGRFIGQHYITWDIKVHTVVFMIVFNVAWIPSASQRVDICFHKA